jgi:hypothetical protein
MSTLPAEAIAKARRAFPTAAPHALKAALEAAAPYIAAAERERIRQLAHAEAKRLRDYGDGWTAIAAGTVADFADLLGGAS